MVDHAAQAQTLYDKTMAVAKKIGPNILYIQKWNHQWVGDLRRLTAEAKQAHVKAEQEMAEYEQEGGNSYQLRPFQVNDYVDEITEKLWWKQVQPAIIEMRQDAKYDYEQYQDDHPKVESSDTMSLHHAEVQMAQIIEHRGADTPQGMGVIVDAISSFADTLEITTGFDRMRPCTPSTLDVITSILPAILAICQMRGAKGITA